MARTAQAQKRRAAKTGAKRIARKKANVTARARANGQGHTADCLNAVTWKTGAKKAIPSDTIFCCTLGLPLTGDKMLGVEPLIPLQKFKSFIKNSPVLTFAGGMALSGGAGFLVRTSAKLLLMKFSLAATLATVPVIGAAAAPLVAAAVISVVVGMAGGVATNLVREVLKQRKLEKSRRYEKGWWKRAVKTGLFYGALGGLAGGAIAHWGELSGYVSEHVSPKIGGAMAHVQGWVGKTASSAMSWCKNAFTEAKRSLTETALPSVKSALTSVQKEFVGFLAPKARGVKEILEGFFSKTPEPSSLPKGLSQIFKAPALEVDPHALQAGHSGGVLKAAAAHAALPVQIKVPSVLSHYLSQETFDHLPENVRKTFAEAYQSNVSPKARMTLFSDTAYYLLNNKSFPSLSAMPAADRIAAAKLLREAATLAQQTGSLDTKLGKIINGNLAYCYRAGIGVAKDMKKAIFHALLGEGSRTGDETIALLRKMAPDSMEEISHKMPLYRKYVLG